jgi:hypothetical protein
MSFLGKVLDFIKEMSLGKFDRGLYYQGIRFQSSIVGGVVTLISIATLLAYSIILLDSIVTKDEYNLDQNYVDLKNSGFEDFTIGHFVKETLQINYFEIVLLREFGYTSCNDVEFNITY